MDSLDGLRILQSISEMFVCCIFITLVLSRLSLLYFFVIVCLRLAACICEKKLLKNAENFLYVSCSCFLFLRVLPVTNCTEIVHAVKHKVFSVTSKNIVCNVYIMRKHNFNNTANPIVMVLNFPVLHFHCPHRWLLS